MQLQFSCLIALVEAECALHRLEEQSDAGKVEGDIQPAMGASKTAAMLGIRLLSNAYGAF